MAVCLGLGSTVLPVRSQAFVPRTITVDAQELEKTGQDLLKEAVYLTQFQQFSAALSRAQLSTQLSPKAPEGWALLGGLYLNLEKTDEGIAALNKSLALDDSNPGVHFSLGAAYFSKADYPASEKSLKAGLKLKPDQLEPLFDLGNTYYKLEKFEDAIATYQKALTQNEKFWPAINNIGLVNYEAGNVDEAIVRWQAASEIDKETGEPILALAVANFKQGKKDEALKLAQKALEMDRRYGDLDFLIENLWGKRLVEDTKMVFKIPKIQETIAKIEAEIAEDGGEEAQAPEELEQP
ncbi:MAG: tetratricopeptide repeat protein [Thermosynechococcaceae cyanobacterium]